MKRCVNGDKCLSSSNGMLPLSAFESGNTPSKARKNKCMKCKNNSGYGNDQPNAMQLFMGARFWVPGNQVAINDHVSQMRLL